ncbi:MAG: hypothetical protein JJT89_17125 [Nitriliruptoraceae bacterium]|nr:hypothetical protein [Nitriliruptoraceae bacterium]
MREKDRKPFATTIGLMRRTTPFLLLNMAVFTGFFLAIVAWLGVFGGLAVFFAERVEILAFVFLMIAIFGPGGILMFARRYLLYLMMGAHIAVATTLLLDGELPEGKGQIAFGREVVRSRFRDVSILFALDRLIHGVVSRFTRRFVRLVDMLPLGGGASNVARIGATIVNRSVSYVDEAILSYAIARRSDNVWQSGRHGVILYAQAYKPILGAAVKIWLLGRVVFLGVLLLLGLIAVPLVMAIDVPWFQVTVVVGTLLLAMLIVRATFEPFAAIYTLVTYHRAIEGLEVNAVWDQRLASVSGKYRELVGKAQESSTSTDPLDTATVPPAAIAGDGAPGGGALPPAATTTSPAAPAPAGRGPAPSFGAMSRGGGRGALGGLIGGAVAQAADGFVRSQQQAQQPAASPTPQPAQPQAQPQQQSQPQPPAPPQAQPSSPPQPAPRVEPHAAAPSPPAPPPSGGTPPPPPGGDDAS